MFTVFVVNVWKGIIEFKRYFFNSISFVATILIFFYLIFFGLKAVGGNTPNFGDTLDGIIVGYFMWLMFITSFQGVSWGIIEEAQRGTLEQVFASPVPFEFQLFSRIVGDLLLNIAFVVPLMYFAAFTTGRNLGFDLLTLLYLLLVGVMSALGVGMMIGGVALIFKRISSFVQILTFGSMTFTMIDPTGSIFLKTMPMSQASYMMRKMAKDGVTLGSFPLADHLTLWGVSALYIALGILVFRFFERRAMLNGTLNQY